MVHLGLFGSTNFIFPFALRTLYFTSLSCEVIIKRNIVSDFSTITGYGTGILPARVMRGTTVRGGGRRGYGILQTLLHTGRLQSSYRPHA